MTTFGIILVLLIVAALLLYWRRPPFRGSGDGLDDSMIRQIEQDGWVDIEEPLDLEYIRDEEARFWEETWDEPDEL